MFNRGKEILIFAGPYRDKPGTITFAGPHIPSAHKIEETQVILSVNDKPAKMRAIYMPLAGTTILLIPTMIKETVNSIGDSEKIEVSVQGKKVFSTETEGAFAARDVLLKCLK